MGCYLGSLATLIGAVGTYLLKASQDAHPSAHNLLPLLL